jgi:hypothetical protein
MRYLKFGLLISSFARWQQRNRCNRPVKRITFDKGDKSRKDEEKRLARRFP